MLYDCWMTRRSCAHKRRENNCANEQKGGMRRRRVCGRWLWRAAIREWGTDSVYSWKLNIAVSEQVQAEFTYRWLYISGHTCNHAQTRSQDVKATAHLYGSLCNCMQTNQPTLIREKQTSLKLWETTLKHLRYGVSVCLASMEAFWIWIRVKQRSRVRQVLCNMSFAAQRHSVQFLTNAWSQKEIMFNCL